MEGVEKVKVKRLYVGRITLVGLGMGLFLGIIFSIILIILSILEVGKISDQINLLNTSFIVGASLIFIIAMVILFGILGCLYALFYNLMSKAGFNIRFDAEDVSTSNIEFI